MTMTRSDVPSVAFLPTVRGDFKIQVFHEATTGFDHVALTLGDMKGPDPVLVRVHSECLTGDVFASTRCDCGPQLHAALDAIVEKGWGALVPSARRAGHWLACQNSGVPPTGPRR